MAQLALEIWDDVAVWNEGLWKPREPVAIHNKKIIYTTLALIGECSNLDIKHCDGSIKI